MNTLVGELRDVADRHDPVAVRDVLESLGAHSFSAAVLVPALVLITPLSGIPTFPTIGAAIILLIVAQWLLGRDHLWLPEVLMRRSLPAGRLKKGLGWLDRPANWIDRITHPRLSLLTRRPLKLIPLLLIAINVVTWPVLELLPMVTTIGAVMVALFAFGLMTRDGLFIVLGYLWAGLVAGAIYWAI